MQRWQERRFLKALIAAQDRPFPSPRRRMVVHVATWLGLALAFFFVFQVFGMPSDGAWPWLAGAFVVGIIVGVVALRDASREQWPALRPHVDFESARARLAELES